MKKSGWTMRKAIMVFCVGCVMAALLMQTFLFQQSLKRQIRTESIADNENTLTKMQAELTTFIHNMRTEMLTVYSEYDLISELREVAQGGQEKVPADGYWWRNWYLGRKRFSSEDRLMAMYLYDAKNQLVSAYRYNCQMFPRDIYKSEYDANTGRVLEYVNGDRTDLMISGYYNQLEEKNIIRFVLKLHNYDEERQKIGYLVCEIDSMAFASIMNKYVDLSHVYLWMQPVNDRTIVVTGEADEDQKRIQKQLSRVIQNYYDSSTLDQEYGDYYLIHVGQAENNLEACALVSQSLLTAAQRSLTRSLLVIMAMMLGLVVVFVMLLSRWLTRPTEQMLETIERIKNGETQLRVQPVGWSEELKVLGTEFNDMLDRVQAMAQEEYKYRLLVERTEYKMLQAQINPHFLYNTLNTMSGIATAQNCPLVSGLCHSLSAVFRYSLNMTDEFSTVQKEMEHVRNYLYVMDVRSGSDVMQEKQIAEETPADAYIESVQKNLDTNICLFIEQNPETTFYIFFPPYSILYWNDVMRENHLEATMAEYQYIADRMLAYDNVRVFYFPNQEWIVTDLNNYADYSHYHRDINYYMTQCFADGSCEVTDSEEMAHALDKMRDIIERFDFEELFSVDY